MNYNTQSPELPELPKLLRSPYFQYTSDFCEEYARNYAIAARTPLIEENERLRADAARLDWLIENCMSLAGYIDGDEYGARGARMVIEFNNFTGDESPDSIRFAIDAALKGNQS